MRGNIAQEISPSLRTTSNCAPLQDLVAGPWRRAVACRGTQANLTAFWLSVSALPWTNFVGSAVLSVPADWHEARKLYLVIWCLNMTKMLGKCFHQHAA